MSVNNYHTTPRNTPEDSRFHQHRRGSLKIMFHACFYFPKDEHDAIHQQTVSSLIMKHSAEMKALQAKLESHRQEELMLFHQVNVCMLYKKLLPCNDLAVVSFV
jgi:hypothetical protein